MKTLVMIAVLAAGKLCAQAGCVCPNQTTPPVNFRCNDGSMCTFDKPKPKPTKPVAHVRHAKKKKPPVQVASL